MSKGKSRTKRKECVVCYEDVPPSKIVTCFCGYIACKTCCENYIFSSIQTPKCMECKSEWTEAFLVSQFSKSWVNTKYRKEYLYKKFLDREKALLEETMEDAVTERKLREIKKRKKEILKEYNHYAAIAREYKIQLNRINEILFNYDGQQQVIHQDDFDLERWIGNLPSNTPSPSGDDENDESSIAASSSKGGNPREGYECPCPREDCNGMIKKWTSVCCLCERKICRRCREPREETEKHTCDPEVLESVRLIKSQTRACPHCGAPIFKIDGCDQIWCTSCKGKPFSFATGEIDHGIIHNPHAIEYMRRRGGLARDLRDVPCGGMVDGVYLARELDIAFDTIRKYNCGSSSLIEDEDIRERVMFIHRRVNGIIQRLYPNYFGEFIYKDYHPDENAFKNLRIEFILGNKTEDEWKRSIYRLERLNQQKRTRRQILQTFEVLIIERFRDLIERIKTFNQRYKNRVGLCKSNEQKKVVEEATEILETFLKDIDDVREFINETFEKEMKGLGTKKIPYILRVEWFIEETRKTFE